MLLHAVIGDVHGQFDALRRLEDRVAAHAAREGFEPRIVTVGDLVDRGPCSAQVVGHVRRGVAAGTHRAVIGNHEQMFLLALEAHAPEVLGRAGAGLPPDTASLRQIWGKRASGSARALPEASFVQFQLLSWLVQGGATTLQSYAASNDPSRPDRWEVDPEDLRFLQAMPVVFRAPGFLVTHALVDRDILAQLDGEDPAARERSREAALWNRRLPAARADATAVHVSGHTPLARVKRRAPLGLVQCDTGAGYGHRLSAWCVETGRALSVAVG